MQIEQLIQLLTALNGAKTQQAEEPTFTAHIGKQCIVRTYASGVFFGTVTKQSGRMVEIANCRRLWQWKAASGISLSSVALYGLSTSGSRLSAPIETQTVLDGLEIIPATEGAIASIVAIKESAAS